MVVTSGKVYGVLFAVLMPTLCFTSSAQGSETRWRNAVAQTKCFSTNPSLENLVSIGAAWDRKSLPEIGTSLGAKDFVGKLERSPNTFFTTADGTSVARRFLSSIEATLKTFEKDAAAYGEVLCPLLYLQTGDSLYGIAKSQHDRRLDAYLEAASYALKVQDCTVSDDEIFGTHEYAAWNSARRVLELANLPEGAVPTPAEVAALLRQPFHVRLCSSAPQRLEQIRLLDLVKLLSLKSDTSQHNCANSSGRQIVGAALNAVLALPRLAEKLNLDCDWLYHGYVGALQGRLSTSDVVEAHVAFLGLHKAGTPKVQSTAESLQFAPVDHYGDLFRLTHLVASSDGAYAALQSHASADGLTVVAVVLLEGLSAADQQIDKGIELIRLAAAAGSKVAALRLGQALEQGYGVPKSIANATETYSQLAEQGELSAIIALITLYEDQDLGVYSAAQARLWYERLFAHLETDNGYLRNREKELADGLLRLLMNGSVFLSSEQGQRRLKQLGRAFASERQDPLFATRFGYAHACAGDCTGILDLKGAADWFRLAADTPIKEPRPGAYERVASTGNLALVKLLLARPELATHASELQERLQEGLRAGDKQSRDLKLVLPFLQNNSPPTGLADIRDHLEKCGGQCTDLAHAMAIGALHESLIEIGFSFLERKSRLASPDWRETGAAYVDALAFYGDFSTATQVLSRDPTLVNVWYDAADSTIRRLVAARVGRKDGQLPKDLVGFLRLAARAGSSPAKHFLKLLETELSLTPTTSATAETLAQQRQLHLSQLKRGGISVGLAQSARSLAQVEFGTGDQQRAIELEMSALRIDIELENARAIENGPLPSRLARACTYSRTSHRIFTYGNAEVAIIVAKMAVNELQAARSLVRALPQRLKLCFSDIVSDHYRWLADLFVTNGRHAEAKFVMGLLQEFESYEFLDRDNFFSGTAFAPMPLLFEEQLVQASIASLPLPLPHVVRRIEELQRLRAQRLLTAEEESELARLNAQLDDYRAKSEAVIRDILLAAKVSSTVDNAARLDVLESITSRLSHELKGEVAVIHFVVLPHRMHAILTTTLGQEAFTWDRLDGQPFTEAVLDQKIAGFRLALESPKADPLPYAQEFYRLFIPLFDSIAVVKPKTLAISFDRKLRYLPLAALHDGKGYVAETYRIFALTETTFSEPVGLATLPISALGTTRAFPNFVALKGADIEVRGLVQRDGYGLFTQGSPVLDDGFDRKTLSSSLRFGSVTSPSMGVVHIASHFKLGETDASSFLLLGSGQGLTVQEIKNRMGVGQEFDFGALQLITLSACQTAVAAEGGDGREVSSFAYAAQKRGARAVLGTVWSVADISTALFMHRLYELAGYGNMSLEAALAKTQSEFISGRFDMRALGQRPSILLQTATRLRIPLVVDSNGIAKLQKYSHPFHWAPFMLMKGLRG